MEKADEQLELILSLPDVELYSIVKSEKKLKEKGVLNLYNISSQKFIILILNEFKYVLNEQIPFMVNDEAEEIRRYAFPYLDSNIGLTLPVQTPQDLIDLFETILSEHTNFVCPSNPNYKEEKLQEKTDDGNKDVKVHEKSKNISAKIAQGGDKIKDGLIKTGTYLSAQIQKGGQYLKKKIKKNKVETKIKEDTQGKVKFVKEASKAVLMYTRAQIEALIVLSKNIGKEIAKNIEKSDTGKKISSHKNYEDALKIGGASIHVLAAVYDGLFEAIFIMARGAKDASTEIVEKKYGKEAAVVMKDGLDTVGNVGYLTRAFKDVAVQQIEQSTAVKQKEVKK